MNPININDRIIIIDNFYTDPDSVRNHALSLELEDKSNGNYGGRMTKNAFITQEHIDAFSAIIGKNVQPASTSFTGKFRFTTSLSDDEYQQLIHFDPGCQYAAVWYGSKNHPEVEGTTFWKHKKYNIDRIPLTQEGIEKYNWYNVDDLKTFLETDGMDFSRWSKTVSVPYKYNTLIVFPSYLFHSPGPSFGTTIEDARLITTFFLDFQDRSKL